MRYETRSDGGIVEHLTEVCSGCGQLFGPGQYVSSWMTCMCAEGHEGHRKLSCRRDVDGDRCGAITFDPPHSGQNGPTGDYGGDGVSAHRPMRPPG